MRRRVFYLVPRVCNHTHTHTQKKKKKKKMHSRPTTHKHFHKKIIHISFVISTSQNSFVLIVIIVYLLVFAPQKLPRDTHAPVHPDIRSRTPRWVPLRPFHRPRPRLHKHNRRVCPACRGPRSPDDRPRPRVAGCRAHRPAALVRNVWFRPRHRR